MDNLLRAAEDAGYREGLYREYDQKVKEPLSDFRQGLLHLCAIRLTALQQEIYIIIKGHPPDGNAVRGCLVSIRSNLVFFSFAQLPALWQGPGQLRVTRPGNRTTKEGDMNE